MDAKKALELLEEAKSYWGDIYDAAKEDIRFSIGKDQWTKDEISSRGESACMIVPVLPQYIHQVVNDMRQNTPSINVLPGEGEGTDPETAKIFKGLIRNIEYKSNADEVYDTAGEYAVRGGFGFIRVDHDYIDDESLLQELKLRRVQNPESVYIDPASVECDGSDAEWAIVLDTISKDDFEKVYPGKAFTSFDKNPTDSKAEEITIAELFIKDYKKVTKQAGEGGKLVDYVDGEEEKKTRDIRKVTIKRYKFSGVDELESTTFPGKYVPIVLCAGEEVWVDGKRYLMSLHRQAKDAQRRVNKWAAKESEILDMAPIAPVQAPVGAVDNFMKEWGSPGDVNVMRYEMYDSQGRKLDKPERLNPPPIPTGIINAMEGAKQSVKEALGIYDSNLGKRSNETSGVAIDARKEQGEVATFHFSDNRNRAIQFVGKILVCAIPEIYDTPRIVQIIGPEEEPRLVGINGASLQQGQKKDYDLRKGKYDVRVTTGPSYTTKRQEAAAVIGEMMKQDPQAKMMFGDLYFKNLDVAGSEALAERMKKIMPPELTADESKGELAPDPEKMQMQQTIQEMQMQMQEMQMQLADKAIKSKELDIKDKELDVKNTELLIKEKELDTKSMMIQEPNKLLAEPVSQEIPVEVPEVLPEEMAVEQADMILRAQQANTALQVLNSLGQQLNALTTQVASPRQVIRDQNGFIQGVQ